MLFKRPSFAFVSHNSILKVYNVTIMALKFVRLLLPSEYMSEIVFILYMDFTDRQIQIAWRLGARASFTERSQPVEMAVILLSLVMPL